jgi:type I restriction enzyme S subunit
MAADPYITSNSQTYSEFGLQQSKMWPPDTLCMTIAGANTAKTAILKIEACFPDSVVGFISDKSKSDLHFVKYSLDLMRQRFLSVSRGATQDNLSLDKLLSFPIPAPDVEEQRRIGAFLSAYDDLMENNQRRIRILEEMARAMYREWFVHFRFSGANAKSAIPDKSLDCATGTLEDLCDLAKIPYDDARHCDLPLLDLAHIPSRTLAPQDTGRPSELTTSRILFNKGDTLFGAIRCYLHKVVIAPYSGVTNISVHVLRSKRPEFRTLLAVLASSLDAIQWADQHSSGTKMPVINGSVLKTMPAPVPSPMLAARFERVAGPILDELCLLSIKNQNLRRTRDLLLPRLLSDAISVR